MAVAPKSLEECCRPQVSHIIPVVTWKLLHILYITPHVKSLTLNLPQMPWADRLVTCPCSVALFLGCEKTGHSSCALEGLIDIPVPVSLVLCFPFTKDDHSVHDLCHDALLPQSPQSQVNVDWPLRNNESYWIFPSLSCVSDYFIKGIESWQTCLVFVPENLLPQGLAISRIYLCFYSTSPLPSLHPISPLSLDSSLPQHDSFRLLTQSHCLCSIVLFISPCSFIKLSILLYLGTSFLKRIACTCCLCWAI